MEATQLAIKAVMQKLKDWEMTTNLTKIEIKSIERDLKKIAGSAIMDANNRIQNILPNLYNQITKS